MHVGIGLLFMVEMEHVGLYAEGMNVHVHGEVCQLVGSRVVKHVRMVDVCRLRTGPESRSEMGPVSRRVVHGSRVGVEKKTERV